MEMNDLEMAVMVWSIGGMLVLFLYCVSNIVFIMGKRVNGKSSFLGAAVLQKKREYFVLSITEKIRKRAETTEYRIIFRKKFVKDNYMEELIIEIGEDKISRRIDEQVDFTAK